MSQRLVRAKARVKETGLRFSEPDSSELPIRLPDVLEAIYAAFGLGWDGPQAHEVDGLPGEAIYLARTLAALLPNEPEALGLLSLLLHVHARRNSEDIFVPLDRQDAALWDRNMIVEAELLLKQAAGHRHFGRFQCEAAIQSVHAQRGVTGQVNHEALDTLYMLLVSGYPTTGAKVAHASVKWERRDLDSAMSILNSIPSETLDRYQPGQVLLALCLRDLGDMQASRRAASKALAMTEDLTVKGHLLGLFSCDIVG